MKQTWLSVLALGALFVGGAAILSGQPGTPVDPMEKAIGHLEKARAALSDEQLRADPQVQAAYQELTLALDAAREARRVASTAPPSGTDPWGTPFMFPNPFAMGFPQGGAAMGDPFEDMRRLREEMDEIMRRNLRQRGDRQGGILPDLNLMGPAADMDILEEEDKFIVTMDLPGVGKDDIRIEARENHLQISGTREESLEESNERDGFLRRERRVGSFSRVVPLPGPIDPGRMEATHENGVLTITAPKKKTVEEESQIVIVK